MTRFEDVVLDQLGRPVGAATVSVFLQGTANLATLYANDAEAPRDNPTTTDSLGRFWFYIADGKYDLQVSGTNITTYKQLDVEISDVSEAFSGDVGWEVQELNNVCFATPNTPGADAGAKIAYCINSKLPATGGTVDATGLEGAQAITQNIFAGVTKPVTLLVGNATFAVSVNQAIATADVSITGIGRKSIFKASAANFNIFTTATARTRFENIALEGAATTDATIQYGIFTTSATPATDGTIKNVWFTGPDATTGLNNGVKLDSNSSNWNITGNTFERLIGVISGTGYGVLTGASYRSIIRGNHFWGAAGQGRHAVYLSAGASYNEVDGNEIDAFNQSSIVISSVVGQPAGQFNLIHDNIITNQALGPVGTAGVELYGTVSFNIVKGNTIVSPGRHGIGIRSEDPASLATDNTLRHNKIYQAGQAGIYVGGALCTEVSANSIFNASTSSPGTYPGIGVWSENGQLANATRIVESNVIYGTTHRDAIYLDPTAPVPTNTVILGNIAVGGVVGAINLNGVAAIVFGNLENLAGPEQWTRPVNFTSNIGVGGLTTSKRFSAANGTPLVAGDFALSAGWGGTAAVSAVTGTDQGWNITVTCGGAGIAATPTITLTFKDGTWTNSPIAISKMVGGNGTITDLTDAPTATTWVITFNGTPVNAKTYLISGITMGR